MLVDNVMLIVKAGNGGNGAATFLRNGQTSRGGPDGGNGGNGGSIYFQGSTNVSDLREFRYKKKVLAENGIPGKRKKLFGKNASHITVYVPLGTQVTDLETNTKFEITDTLTHIMVAKGGSGGRGNDEFKSATNQTPMFAEEGRPGEKKILYLELKLIADIGLVGLPNAGKSSLLSVLTNAMPKIGDYPFTTLEPNIGMLNEHPIADIPGLIEGASNGRGLGVRFLKHIEKTKILVHCIDAAIENIEDAYEIVRSEFGKYNPILLRKPELILLTKSDLFDENTIKKYRDLFRKKKKTVLACSVYDEKSIEVLKETLGKMLVSKK